MVAVAKRRKPDSSFGARLRRLREAAGLTLIEMGERAGMPYQNIARFERGEREPTWGTLIKLADSLNVSLDEFRRTATDDPPADAAPSTLADALDTDPSSLPPPSRLTGKRK